MIRDPYEAPTTRMRACSRRAFLTRPDTEQSLSLDSLDDETLASLSRFRGLRALHLSTCELGPLALAALRTLTALGELSLWRCEVTAPGLEDALASLPLRSLSLDRPRAHRLDVTSLLPRFEALASLSLDFAGEADTPILDSLAALPTLRWLRLLYASHVTDANFARLTSLTALEGLTLHGCEQLHGETLDALVSLQSLRALRLVACGLTRASQRHFASLQSLRAIDLSICKDLSIEALLPLQSLEVLRLMSAQPGGAQIGAIGDFAHLTHLELGSDHDLRDTHLRGLAERLTLRAMGVASTEVRGDAFRDVARWSALEAIDVSFTRIDDATVARLATLPRLACLEMCYCNDVSSNGLSRLADCAALVELNVQGVSAVDDAVLDGWARRPRWEELTLHGCTRVTGRSVVPFTGAHPEARVRCETHRFSDRSVAAHERYDARVRSIELCDDPTLAALVTPSAVLLVDRPSGRRRNKKSIPSKDAIVRLDPKGRVLLAVAKKARLWDAHGRRTPAARVQAVAHRRRGVLGGRRAPRHRRDRRHSKSPATEGVSMGCRDVDAARPARRERWRRADTALPLTGRRAGGGGARVDRSLRGRRRAAIAAPRQGRAVCVLRRDGRRGALSRRGERDACIARRPRRVVGEVVAEAARARGRSDRDERARRARGRP